ncbi:MAG: NAD(P)-dependent oxidoreductase [Planctomycetota bacterium]|jgi:3-hydroxyisobutyrate dehydrogenase-like beta-hydroxyacid dehydrogenase
MGDISFLGLGGMGFALANTITKAGYDTVVWNRTEARATPLLENGAKLATSPAEAIIESPITIVCVSNYEAAETFLRTPESLAALKGRVLIQLSTGAPNLARATDEWIKQAGASYLDGEIVAWVEQIGGPESQILIAGDENAYLQAETLLKILAPLTKYLGDNPARSSAINLGILSGGLGLITGILNGAAICESEGVSIAEFGDIFPLLMRYDAEELGERVKKIEAGGLEESDAPIEMWAATIDPMIECANETGYNPNIPMFIKDFFDRAIKQGLGGHDVGALIHVLRPGNR